MRVIRKYISLAGLIGAATCYPSLATPVSPSPEAVVALESKAPNANLLLLREVSACRKATANQNDCLELMLLAAERDSGYQSADEAAEALPTNAEVAVEARKLLLARISDSDLMLGLEGSAAVDPEWLLQMERATPNILGSDQPGAGLLRVAIAQQLYLGGAEHIAVQVLNPTIGATDALVAKEFGGQSAEIARALNTIGAVEGSIYPRPGSIAQLALAVTIYSKLNGPGAVSTAVAMHNMAALRLARGETAEAIRLERTAHSALLGKLGREDRRTLTAALTLGIMLSNDGDLVLGMPIAKDAVAGLAKVAPNSPQLATALTEIANLDPAMPPAEKVTLLEQAVSITEKGNSSALLEPLRQTIGRAKGYPDGIFLIENNQSKVLPGNAQEIALLERIFEQKRSSALASGYTRLAREMLDQKRFTEARTLAQKAIALEPRNDSARVIPVYASINEQAVGTSIDVMAINDVQVMIVNYEQSGRALSPEVMEAHLMLGLSNMKANGPLGATYEFDKAAQVVKGRLSGRGNFDAKARRDLNTLRPVFRGQVMLDWAAASQLSQ